MVLPNNPNQLDVVKAVQDFGKSLANIENIIFYNNTITKSTVINLSSYAYIGNTFAVNQIIGIIFSQNNNDSDKSFIHQNIQKVKVTAVDGNNVTVENINGDTSSKFLFNDYVEFYHSTSSDNTAYKQGMSRKGISDALTLLDNKIPTKTSQLTNDSGFVTSSAIPTKTSQLTNDSGFMTSSTVPNNFQPAPNHLGTPTTPPNDSLWTPAKSGWVMFSCTSHGNGSEFYLKIGSSTGLMVGCSLGTGGGKMNYNNCPSMTLPVEAGETYYVHYYGYSAHYYSS